MQLEQKQILLKSFLTQENLQSILQQGIGEVITVFSKQTYRIQPIRQNIAKKLSTQYKNIASKQIIADTVDKISIFLWILAKAPGVWIMLLNSEKLCGQSTELDLYLFTSKVYKTLIHEGTIYLSQFSYYCDLVTKAIIHYLEFISNQITVVYNCSKKLVIQQIDELNTDTKQMRLLNKYMVFKLLKELNESLRQRIKKTLETSIFCYVDPEQIESFINYIIDKHDIINFVFDKNKKKKDNRNISLQDQFAEKILMLGSNMKKIHYRKATRQDGKRAMFLEIQKGIQDEQQVQSYLITVDSDGEDEQLLVYNPAFTRKKWSIQDRASENQSIDDLLKSKGGAIKSMRGAPNQVKVLPKNAHTIGGSLGNCLADLNKYNSFESFLADFSKKAFVSTSLNMLVANMPVMGYVLVVGGFSLTFYNLLNNQFKSDKKKLQDLGGLLLGSTTSLGTGLVGGLIGSAFIPIPVLGFFLGGLIGGFVGGVTSNAIQKSLQSAKFKSIIQSLKKYINQQGPQKGSWQVTQKMVRNLGTQLEYFLNNIPQNLTYRVGCDRHWFALIGFCLLTFFQTNNQIKQKQRQLKQQKTPSQSQISRVQVSPYLELSLSYLQKTRIDLRPNIKYLQIFFKQMFSGA